MATTVGGLVSGIDTDTMVSQLVAAAAKPRTVIAKQKAALEDKQDAFGTLRSRGTALVTALEQLDTAAEFRSTTGASQNEDAVGVTVDGDAAVGTFTVSVSQLAQSAMYVSDAFTGITSKTADGAFAQGSFDVTYNGATTSVTVGASSSSLQDVVDAINADVEGVSAYIMDTGDAANPFRIVLSGEDTGSAFGISVSTAGLTGAGQVPTFTESVAAQDALLKVNGIDVTSADNDVEGVIDGVTFNLRDEVAVGSEVKVNVQRDIDAMVEKMNGFVTAYNSVISYIRTQSVYNSEENIKGPFVGESTQRSLKEMMQTLVSSSYSVSTSVSSLGRMGFETKQNGELSLDEDALRGALSDNFDACVTLFTADGGVNKALRDGLDNYVDTDDGVISERIDGLDDRIEAQQDRLDRFDRKLDAYEKRLKNQFLNMELAMSRFQSAGQSLLALMPDTSSGSN